MRLIAISILAAAPLFAALPATAQIRTVAADEIVQGDYSQAEAKLQSELRANPTRPELLLNLAVVYAHTGRTADARRVYAQVLQHDDVKMDLTGNRLIGSHAIAERGMRKLGDEPQFTASR